MRRISFVFLLIFLIIGAVVPHAWAENENICFSFPDLTGEPGTNVTMGLQVTDADSIFAVDATVTYPADKLTAISVVKTDFSNDMFLFANLNTPGQIGIAMAGVTAISGDGELFQISFDLAGSAGETGEVELTSILIDDVAHSECIQNGSISIVLPPAVTTDAATSVTHCAATLNGTVNPNGAETTVVFEWGESDSYGNEVAATEGLLTGTTDQAVSAEIADLDPNATYHYRVKATNTAGATYGSDHTLTTQTVSFAVTTEHSGTETAGTPFSVILTAKDGNGNTATGFEGDHNIAWTWTASNSPNSTAPTKPADGNQTFTAGVATIPGFTLANSGETPAITATANGVSGTSDAIIVNDGALDHVKVESAAGGTGSEVYIHSMTADEVLTVYSAGYDAYGNYREDVSVTWSGTGICSGNLNPTLGTSTTFTAVTSGTGTITADHASATDDETGEITVTAGALDHIVIETTSGGTGTAVDTVSITTDETYTVYAIGYDLEDNYREDVSVTWSWVSGAFDAGDLTTTTGASTTFEPNNAGAGVLKADDGNGHEDSTGTLTAIDVKDELAIDFKTTGIYVYNTGIWNRIYQGVDPEGLCSFGTYLAVDFGTSYGLYVYDAGAWTRVHKGVAIEKMAGFGGKLAVDFGASYPLYEYNFAADTWTPIYNYSSPRDTIEALGDKLVVDFKTAGIYVYDAGIWNRIYKGVDPVNIVSFGDKLAIDFGTAYGLYVYEYDTDNWTKVYKGVAIEKMSEIDGDLAVDFGTAYGLYVYEFDTDNWTRVYKGVAIEKMAGFDGNLAVDFGTSYPIYEYDFDTDNWNSIYQYSSPRDELVPANIFD